MFANRISKENFFTTCNNSSIERLNIKLCRYLLGVHKKSSNHAVRGELGRYPLLITLLHHSFRFYKRLFLSNKFQSLVTISCSDTEVYSYEKSWISVMNKLYKMFNQSTSVRTIMLDLYKKEWNNLMLNLSSDPDSKLRTYAKFKNSFNIENYILQFPLHLRRNLTKLRISAHNLAIETGRYTKPIKTPVEKRTCFHCGGVENELHFISICQLFEEERSLFVKSLNEISTIDFVPTNECLSLILSYLNGDIEVCFLVCNYINSCFDKRTLALNEKREREIFIRPKLTITHSGRHSRRPEKMDL